MFDYLGTERMAIADLSPYQANMRSCKKCSAQMVLLIGVLRPRQHYLGHVEPFSIPNYTFTWQA